MKTGREISSGGIVYKSVRVSGLAPACRSGSAGRGERAKEIKVALICRGEGKIWGLPKGKLEKGETPEQAAVREVEEETGLKAEIEAKLGDIKYVYYAKWDDTKYFKVVSFYLMRYVSGDINSHDSEVEEVRFFAPNEALHRLTYKGEKDMMRKAIKKLTG